MNLTKDEYNILIDALLSEKQTCMIEKLDAANMEYPEWKEFENRKQMVENIINKIKGVYYEN